MAENEAQDKTATKPEVGKRYQAKVESWNPGSAKLYHEGLGDLPFSRFDLERKVNWTDALVGRWVEYELVPYPVGVNTDYRPARVRFLREAPTNK